MPEESRDGAFDAEEEFGWDCDLAYGEDEENEAEGE